MDYWDAHAATSPSTSCSLSHHGAVRLLWLPLSVCVKMTGIKHLAPRHSLLASTMETSRIATPRPRNNLFDQTNVETGLEKVLKQSFKDAPAIPMKELEGAFPPQCKRHYVSTAHLHFHIDEEIGSSQWENMESYRKVGAVMVVVVCSEYEDTEIPMIIESTRELFDTQYKGLACRCIVFDPPKFVEQAFQRKEFVKVTSPFKTQEVTASVLVDMAFAFVSRINLEFIRYQDPSSVGDIFLRTPVDRFSASNTIELKKKIAVSRVIKKKADLLILLGAFDLALDLIADTSFASNVDALWCASTLESIAAARLYQLVDNLSYARHMGETILQLQSDALVWSGSLTPLIKEMEEFFLPIPRTMKRLISKLKGSSVPKSMRQRLDNILDDVIAPKVNTLKEVFAVIHQCISAGTNEIPDNARAYYIGQELKECVEVILLHEVLEIEIYLREAQRQMRHATENLEASSSSGVGSSLPILQDRYQECNLKLLSFYAIKGNRVEFLTALSQFRLAFHIHSMEAQNEPLLLYFVQLSLFCDCKRMAVAILLEVEFTNRKNFCYDAAVQSLVQACLLSGIPLLTLPLFDDLPRDISFEHVRPYQLYGTGSTDTSSPEEAAGKKDAEKGKEEYQPDKGSCRKMEEDRLAHTRGSHIPLLLELIDLFAEAGCENGNRATIALFLLFYYPHLLSKSLQEYLFYLASKDIVNLKDGEAPTCSYLPLFSSWEVLPLPPHLAPKTVSVSGPVFTFIDTARLKLTVMSLNGRKLNCRTVWCVGDVGTVRFVVFNPLRIAVTISRMALIAASCSTLNEDNSIPSDAVVHKTGPLAPSSYILKNLLLEPLTRKQIVLQVKPQNDGYIRIEGVQISIENLGTKVPFTTPLPEPVAVPVLKTLPLVSLTVSKSELEVFSGQCVKLTVRVVNCGSVPVEHITLTAHSAECQLEDCEGCLERISRKNCTVTLIKAALTAVTKAPLQPGDAVTIPVNVQAPGSIEEMAVDFVVFRVDCSLPHETPTMPPDVPPAVPVFGVIPRRVMETRMRLFQSPTLSLPTVMLTKDRRFIDIRLMNLSSRYSVDLFLSKLGFADLPNALLVPGAEFVVPPIEVSSVPESQYRNCAVPWSIRELPHCSGKLHLDFSLIGNEGVCTEPLDECVVEIETSPQHQRWKSRSQYSKTAGPVDLFQKEIELLSDTTTSDGGTLGEDCIYVSTLQPARLSVRVHAPWQRSIPLQVKLSFDPHCDVGSLIGVTNTICSIGEMGKVVYMQTLELLTFKDGLHHITIVIRDLQGREITYLVPISISDDRD